MRNTIGRNTDQSKKQRLSKKDSTYKNWREYIHNVTPVLSFPKAFQISDLKDLLQIFDNINDFEFLEVDFSKVVDKESLYKLINDFVERYLSGGTYGFAGKMHYNHKKKCIEHYDIGLSFVSKSVMGTNFFPLLELEHTFPKDLAKYVRYFMFDSYVNCKDSYQYGWWIHEAPQYYADQMDEYGVFEEDYKVTSEEYAQAKILSETIMDLETTSFKGIPKVNQDSLSNDQKLMYQYMQDLIAFDYQVVKDLIDIEEHINTLEPTALDEHMLQEYPEDAIVEEFYNGMYVPTYDDYSKSGDMLQHYVEYMNSLENECLWYFNVQGKADYYKDKVVIKENKEQRDMVVERMNNVIRLNRLTEKMYNEFHKNQKTEASSSGV